MAKQPTPGTPGTKSPALTKKHLARIERERRQTRIIMFVAIAIAVIVIGLVGYGIADQYLLKMIRPAAKVDGETIRVKDFFKQVQYTRWQYIQQYQNDYQFYQFFASSPEFASSILQEMQRIQYQLDASNAVGLANTTLDRMIDDVVIRREAKARGITVSEAEVDELLQSSFRYYPNGTPTPTITPTSIVTPTYSKTLLALITLTPTVTREPTLEISITPTLEPTFTSTPDPSFTATATLEPSATATPYTLEGFQTAVATYVQGLADLGFDDADVRELARIQLLRQKVAEAVTADLKPEEEQVWARHILVSDEATALLVVDRLKQGEDFASLAALLSQDTSNKDTGGDLGWFGRGTMVAEFEDAAFALQVGEISQPVKTTFGYHIIQVLAHENRPLDATEFNTYKQTVFQEWLTKTEESMDIQRFEQWVTIVPTEPNIPAELMLQTQ